LSGYLNQIAGKCPVCGQVCESRLHHTDNHVRYSFACKHCDLAGYVKVKKAK